MDEDRMRPGHRLGQSFEFSSVLSDTGGWVTGRTSSLSTKPVPLPNGSLPEQEEEQDQGGTG